MSCMEYDDFIDYDSVNLQVYANNIDLSLGEDYTILRYEPTVSKEPVTFDMIRDEIYRLESLDNRVLLIVVDLLTDKLLDEESRYLSSFGWDSGKRLFSLFGYPYDVSSYMPRNSFKVVSQPRISCNPCKPVV